MAHPRGLLQSICKGVDEWLYLRRQCDLFRKWLSNGEIDLEADPGSPPLGAAYIRAAIRARADGVLFVERVLSAIHCVTLHPCYNEPLGGTSLEDYFRVKALLAGQDHRQGNDDAPVSGPGDAQHDEHESITNYPEWEQLARHSILHPSVADDEYFLQHAHCSRVEEYYLCNNRLVLQGGSYMKSLATYQHVFQQCLTQPFRLLVTNSGEAEEMPIQSCTIAPADYLPNGPALRLSFSLSYRSGEAAP
jgi:hypothetical protein